MKEYDRKHINQRNILNQNMTFFYSYHIYMNLMPV